MANKLRSLRHPEDMISELESTDRLRMTESWLFNNSERIKTLSYHGTFFGKICLSGISKKIFERHKLDMVDPSIELEIPSEKCVLNHLRFKNLDYKRCESSDDEVSTIFVRSVEVSGWVKNT